MPSFTKENYLKAIYFLDQKGKDIALTDISKKMGVSNPTTNNMVKKLQEAGWLIYERYKPLQLTSQGRKVGALIVRKHRLTEMFLTKIMGFGWEEVHDVAEEMEHIQSNLLFERMDEILGHPTVDPHGSPIPNRHGEIVMNSYLSLSEMQEGQQVRLCALANSSRDLLKLLNGKRIKLGTEMTILQKEDFDQSIVVQYDRQSSVTLSDAVCQSLLVEKVQ